MRNLFIVLTLLIFALAYQGCSSDNHNPSNAYQARALNLIIEPGHFSEAEIAYIVSAAKVHSKYFEQNWPGIPAPTDVHVRYGQHVYWYKDPTPLDGFYDSRNNIIVVPAGPVTGFKVNALYHELWHRHAPRQTSYDANHSYFDWLEIGRVQSDVIAEINSTIGLNP